MSRAQSKADAAQAAQAAVLAELRPGQSVELLKELHILTREGRLNQDSRRKLKQVYHLYQFIEPLLAELSADGHAPLLADHGAGKSYLGFILYDLFFKSLGRGEIYGIEWRAELVERSRALAQRLGFERMQFLDMAVADAAALSGLPERFDIVTALHACDTATDDAIAFGLQKQARAMVLVPCCQAEVAASLRQPRPCPWRARRWPSCGATRSTRASSAARSPMCCAACTWRPPATRSPSPSWWAGSTA